MVGAQLPTPVVGGVGEPSCLQKSAWQASSSSSTIIVRPLSRITTMGVCTPIRARNGAASGMRWWYPRWRSACRMSHAVMHHHRPLAWYSMRRSANHSSRQDIEELATPIWWVLCVIFDYTICSICNTISLHPYTALSNTNYILWLLMTKSLYIFLENDVINKTQHFTSVQLCQ